MLCSNSVTFETNSLKQMLMQASRENTHNYKNYGSRFVSCSDDGYNSNCNSTLNLSFRAFDTSKNHKWDRQSLCSAPDSGFAFGSLCSFDAHSEYNKSLLSIPDSRFGHGSLCGSYSSSDYSNSRTSIPDSMYGSVFQSSCTIVSYGPSKSANRYDVSIHYPSQPPPEVNLWSQLKQERPITLNLKSYKHQTVYKTHKQLPSEDDVRSDYMVESRVVKSYLMDVPHGWSQPVTSNNYHSYQGRHCMIEEKYSVDDPSCRKEVRPYFQKEDHPCYSLGNCFAEDSEKHNNELLESQRREIRERAEESISTRIEMTQEGYRHRDYLSDINATPDECQAAIQSIFEPVKKKLEQKISGKKKNVFGKLLSIFETDPAEELEEMKLDLVNGYLDRSISKTIQYKRVRELGERQIEAKKAESALRKAAKLEKRGTKTTWNFKDIVRNLRTNVTRKQCGGGKVSDKNKTSEQKMEPNKENSSNGEPSNQNKPDPPSANSSDVRLGEIIAVDKHDLESLAPGEWMTCEAVYSFLHRMVADFNLDRNSADSVVLFQPLFAEHFLNFESSKEKQTAEQVVKMYQCFVGRRGQINRALVPVLRNNHYILVHYGLDANDNVHAHIMDSLLTEDGPDNEYLTNEEARKIGAQLFSVETKEVEVSRANEHMKHQGNTVDCGPHTILSAEACLRDQRFNPDIRRITNTRNPENETIRHVRGRILETLREISGLDAFEGFEIESVAQNTDVNGEQPGDAIDQSSPEPQFDDYEIVESPAKTKPETSKANSTNKFSTDCHENGNYCFDDEVIQSDSSYKTESSLKLIKQEISQNKNRKKRKSIGSLIETYNFGKNEPEVVVTNKDSSASNDEMKECGKIQKSYKKQKQCEINNANPGKQLKKLQMEKITLTRGENNENRRTTRSMSEQISYETNVLEHATNWSDIKDPSNSNELPKRIVDCRITEFQSQKVFDDFDMVAGPENDLMKDRMKSLYAARVKKREMFKKLSLEAHEARYGESKEDKKLCKNNLPSSSSHNVPADLKMIESFDPELKGAMLSGTKREQAKRLQLVKGLISQEQRHRETSSSSSVSASSKSSSDDSYSPSAKVEPVDLSMDQKAKLCDLFARHEKSMTSLCRRFNLSTDVRTARRQIKRFQRDVTSLTPNKRQAYRLLKKRVAELIRYRDEYEQLEIHEETIERFGREQAHVFGLADFKASKKWVHMMKKYMNLTSRHIDSRIVKPIVGTKNTVEDDIKHFKSTIVPQIMKKYSMDRVFNVDQTGIKYELTRNRTLTQKGRNKVNRACQSKSSVTHSYTVNPCISADGKLVATTFVTLKEQTPPRSFRQMVAPFDKLRVTHSKSGIMTSELAIDWLKNSFLPNVRNGSLLLLDSWNGFEKMKKEAILRQRKIEIITFPKKTTSELQPLDLSFNRQFKTFLKKLQTEIRYRAKHIKIGKRANQLDIISMAINQFGAPRFSGLIQRGFYKIGIFTSPPPHFETPAEYCFSVSATGGKICKNCRGNSFFRCGYCETLLCVACSVKHLH